MHEAEYIIQVTEYRDRKGNTRFRGKMYGDGGRSKSAPKIYFRNIFHFCREMYGLDGKLAYHSVMLKANGLIEHHLIGFTANYSGTKTDTETDG